MAEYYDGYGSRKDGVPQRSLSGQLLDSMMTIVTIIVAVIAAFTYASPYINPSSIWIFSILGLGAPLIYLVVVMLTFYWIIRWRWLMASVMITLSILGFFKVSLFYKPELRRVYDEFSVKERHSIRFMTYNVRSFYGETGQSSVDETLQLISKINPHIVCLQEFNPWLTSGKDTYEAFCRTYTHSAGGSGSDPTTASIIIFSKFPILRWGPSHESVPSDGQRESIWADLRIEDDTVRIFNNHLHSTTIKASDNEFITKHQYISDTARDVKIRSIVRRLRDNNILRAQQVDSIAVTMNETPYARIVCGDFNDTPMSYIYRKMSVGLNDAFSEAGRGFSHTFRGFFNTLRIDYVLSSDDFETLTYEVCDVDYSDHHPVVVQFRYTPRH